MCIELSDITSIVGLSIASGALIFTAVTFIKEKGKMRNDSFSQLLKEIASDEARQERGLIIRNILNDKHEKDMAYFKIMINSVRYGGKAEDIELGIAIERTIARLDRVGFFLVGGSKRPKSPITQPPKWLWDMVDTMWNSLGQWVQQSCSETSRKNYAYYFEKLANQPNRFRDWAR